MTYWNREHEHNLRRIGDATRDLEAVYEDLIPTLIQEMGEDDFDATEDSRAYLRLARTNLAQALRSLDMAKNALPTPRVPGPIAIPTAAEVMEREG